MRSPEQKKARNERRRRQYAENPERFRAEARAWRAKNIDRYREYCKYWYQKTSKQRLARERAWRLANLEEARALDKKKSRETRDRTNLRRRTSRAKNPTVFRERDRLRYQNDPRVRLRRKRDRIRNKDKILLSQLKQYGLTIEVFNDLVCAQSGLCAICGVAPLSGKRLVIDHNHETGAVRGLLCRSCNLCLGHYEKTQRPAGLRIAPYEKYLSVSDRLEVA